MEIYNITKRIELQSVALWYDLFAVGFTIIWAIMCMGLIFYQKILSLIISFLIYSTLFLLIQYFEHCEKIKILKAYKVLEGGDYDDKKSNSYN